MEQTRNYQLNQWAKTDRILMEDFNGDNLKIDGAMAALAARMEAETAAREAAIAALQAEQPVVKLVDVTTQEAAVRVDVDVSGINFLNYAQVNLCLDAPRITTTALTSYIYLRVNGGIAYEIGTGGNSSPYLAAWPLSSGTMGGLVLLSAPGRNCIQALSAGCTGYALASGPRKANCTWSGLQTLNFLEEDGKLLSARTRILLYGVKR